MSFQDSPDYRALIDPSVQYMVRLQSVRDRETRIGEALEWSFALFNRDTGAPIFKDDGTQLVITRITAPQATPKSRTRRFIHALLGQELTKDQLKALIQSGTLPTRLRNRTALAFVEFEAAQDGTEYPRINELMPADQGKGGNGLPTTPTESTPQAPKKTYTEVFGSDDKPADDTQPSSTAGAAESTQTAQELLDEFMNVRLPTLAKELDASDDDLEKTLTTFEPVLNAAAAKGERERLVRVIGLVESVLRDRAGNPPAAA